jgi:hypothetical protein
MQPRIWLIALVVLAAVSTSGCLGGANASATGAPPGSGSSFPFLPGVFPTIPGPDPSPAQVDQAEQVPEPASLMLMGLGLIALPLVRLKRRDED